ncbi:MAG: Rrf2 family transcriptional regulator, partial [Dinghuibacter sp.]|nr:Rrf2 family transcriptional regulator [Dinghuibacter sp.]
MKITAQEEYGLRLLIRIARCADAEGMSIPQLSDAEGISSHYAAKLARQLRLAGFLNSTPGLKGGYILSRPATDININAVLKALGGALFESGFCENHNGQVRLCTNSVDCSARSLWKLVQLAVDQVLNNISLADLCGGEDDALTKLKQFVP